VRRVRIKVEGIVQGVGFRPFVYQSAMNLGLSGWVLNDSRGVEIEVEGEDDRLEDFLSLLRHEHPPLASISGIETADILLSGEKGFAIRESRSLAEKTAQISPDSHVCDDCLSELFDPSDRRYRYPFINCTNCGPRYTIVTAIPYDRLNTTMADFPMCPACRAEYDDPSSRRFHAQPNACPDCGPSLAFLDDTGAAMGGADPLEAAVALLKAGRIVALKGLGGYHLAVDAANEDALIELRRRKGRDEKPFALMVRDLSALAPLAEFDEIERSLLLCPERPIVLLRRKQGTPLASSVAPKNRYYGVMLPYTPLHHLLMENFDALVMTSANLSDEPIAFEDDDARTRLAGIADAFLVHDRHIHIRADDSIARVMAGRPLLLRRSRGYAPRSVLLPWEQPPILAVGGELKNTVCLTRGNRAFLSQHVGDIKNVGTFDALRGAVNHLEDILEIRPVAIAHDLHPDYLSTRYAEDFADLPKIAVQHHHAHLVSCLAENGVEEKAIGVIFDGIGYGDDGTIWGGEFLVGDASGYERVGRFAHLPMPGGDAATREPYRMALSSLVHAYGANLPDTPLLERIPEKELPLLLRMIEKGINSPPSSSCGRLFDAVAALAGVRDRVTYEGQAALEFEMSLDGEGNDTYRYEVSDEDGLFIFDHAPLIRSIVDDVAMGTSASVVSRRFHNTLAAMVAEICTRIRDSKGIDSVALSGGVFQNRAFTEMTVISLRRGGFKVYIHSLVPPNDGGLSLGQAVIAGRSLSLSKTESTIEV